jgi:hypothetical protein
MSDRETDARDESAGAPAATSAGAKSVERASAEPTPEQEPREPLTPIALDEEEEESLEEEPEDLAPVLEWDSSEEPPFNWLNLCVIGLGAAAMILGFVLLEQVNPDASNWQGAWSPLLLLAGYGLVAVGILIERDPGGDDVDESRGGESFG